MKESEAQKNLAKAIKSYQQRCNGATGDAMAEAARDLLNAEPDAEALPWKVAENGEIVAAFKHMTYAQDFVEDHDWHDSRKPVTITGPDDDKTSEPSSNNGLSTRMVPITDWPRKTLDQMPEGEPHRCVCPDTKEQVVRLRFGGTAYSVSEGGGRDGAFSTPCHEFTVLDADPLRPKTVGELELLDVFEQDGRRFILTETPGGGALGTAVCLKKKIGTPVAKDTPITGEICRFETEADQQ